MEHAALLPEFHRTCQFVKSKLHGYLLVEVVFWYFFLLVLEISNGVLLFSFKLEHNIELIIEHLTYFVPNKSALLKKNIEGKVIKIAMTIRCAYHFRPYEPEREKGHGSYVWIPLFCIRWTYICITETLTLQC